MSEHDTTPQSIGADLAFVRALVTEGGRTHKVSGAIFLAAGLIYGAQCLAGWTGLMGWLNPGAIGNLVLGVGPTVLFAIVLTTILVANRRQLPGGQGVASRALNAAYGSAGLANLVMCVVFGCVAATEKSFLIWLLYPIVVCALQGAVWYIAYFIRRKPWLATVSVGWFVTALTAGFLIHNLAGYVLVLGAALILLMALPGYVMMKLADRD